MTKLEKFYFQETPQEHIKFLNSIDYSIDKDLNLPNGNQLYFRANSPTGGEG